MFPASNKLRKLVPRVAIVFNDEQIKILMDNHPIKKNDNNFYLDLSDGRLIDYRSLSSSGFEKINIDDSLLFEQETFLKSYIDLVGKVGALNNTREWWATELASKSRITSNLPVLLNQYVKCAAAIRNVRYNILLIISPEPNLIYPLQCLIDDEVRRLLSLGHYPEIFYSTYLLRLIRNVMLIKRRVKRYFTLAFGVIKQSLVLAWKVSYTKRNFSTKLIKVLDKEEIYTVIKTHVYESSFDESGQLNDSFFGRLPHFLAQRKNVLSLAHIHGDTQMVMQKINNNQNLVIIPWEYFLKIWDILSAIPKFLFWRIRFEAIYFDSVDVSQIIREEIKRTRFSFYQYLFYDSVKHFVKSFKIEKFIYTYENIPWEKMSILALRQFSPETRIIGYQHSIVPQSDLGVFVSQHEIDCAPLPDKILTNGKVTKDILCRYSDYKKDMVETACALRYEYLFKNKPKQRTKSGNILLVLEGAPVVYKLVNYVLGQLWTSNSYHLTIRTHPILPIDKISHKIDYDIENYPMVTISENDSVLDDLEKSDIVIYWGTTVAIEAVSIGIPLIRYNMGNFLSYDPLFECNHLKWECSEGDSLIDIIESIYQLSDLEFSNRALQAKKYTDRYFHPVTDSNLNKFVNA